MFVGDSLSNNMWQSLTCMLHVAAPSSKYTLTQAGLLSTFYLEVKDLYNRSILLKPRSIFLPNLIPIDPLIK